MIDRDRARRDVDDVDVRAPDQVRVRTAIGGERDPAAVGRPGGLLVGDRAVGQAAGHAGRHVDQPEVDDPVVDEARAVEHVAEPIDRPEVGSRRFTGAGPGRARPPTLVAGRSGRSAGHDQSPAVGRPFEAINAAWQVGQATGLAAVQRQEVDLHHLVAASWPHASLAAPARGGSAGRRGRPASGRRARSGDAGRAARRGSAGGPARSRRSGRPRAPGGSRRSPGATVWTVTTASRPSGDRRGSVATRRRYRSSGRGGRGTGDSWKRGTPPVWPGRTSCERAGSWQSTSPRAG